MPNSASLLFFLRRPKQYISGPFPIYLRITVNGHRKEVVTGRQCDPAKWNPETGRMIGSKEAAKILNNFLDSIVAKIHKKQNALLNNGEPVTVEALRLKSDPFLGYSITVHETDPIFLLEDELQKIIEKKFSVRRLELVRDMFVFSCYTGLAFIDVFNLTPKDISIGIDGRKWIITSRQKTDGASHIPLLPPAMAILQKYSDNPVAVNKGRLLPILSNQKMNAYLKEIADLSGVNKELTFHCARHTFATTVTLSNGIPLESVSKMLGHKKIQSTQHYARILDKKVSDDMSHLFNKFEKSKEQDQEAVGL